MVRQDTLRNRARAEREKKKLCPESRRSIQIRESPVEENAIRFSQYWWPESSRAGAVVVFELIFIIYFPPCDNVSLLRALKAISEFVVDRLLVQFINLFLVSPRTRLALFCNSTFFLSRFSFFTAVC